MATVDQRGRVVAIGKGTAIIWAISMSNPGVQTAFQTLVLNPEDMIFTQVTSTSKVSMDGYVSASLSGLMENGYSVPVQLISFEVLSHTGEVNPWQLSGCSYFAKYAIPAHLYDKECIPAVCEVCF